MLFSIVAIDRPGRLERRKATRPAHLAFLADSADRVRAAGAFLAEDGTPTGSVSVSDGGVAIGSCTLSSGSCTVATKPCGGSHLAQASGLKTKRLLVSSSFSRACSGGCTG